MRIGRRAGVIGLLALWPLLLGACQADAPSSRNTPPSSSTATLHPLAGRITEFPIPVTGALPIQPVRDYDGARRCPLVYRIELGQTWAHQHLRPDQGVPRA